MGFILTAVVALTAGTMFLMWVGEQVTERGVGNGVSLIIFAGIVAGPAGRRASPRWNRLQQRRHERHLADPDRRWWCWSFTYFVVFVESGQRRITVNYARRQGGRSAYMNQSSFLPLKLNMSGVIPPIFASSIIMFPATVTTWFGGQGGASSGFQLTLQRISQALSPGEPLHMILFAALIIGFAFFYTALVFNSQETADNLKKSGALIPGIRPGKATADYIDGVLTRLTAAGAVYLVLVCLLPEIMRTGPGYLVLLRRHLAADRGGGGDGLHRADPGAPDVAPVRKPVEEGEPERRLARLVAQLTKAHRVLAAGRWTQRSRRRRTEDRWATRAAVSRAGKSMPVPAPE